MNMNKKTLVTGAAGLLGVYLIRELLKKNEPILAIYRTKIPTQLTQEELDKITWIKGDILDVLFLEEVMQECNKVYHCAGLVSFSPRRVRDLYRSVVNCEVAALSWPFGLTLDRLVSTAVRGYSIRCRIHNLVS
jgi:nucleoside-diphosphate-sugar epimerase